VLYGQVGRAPRRRRTRMIKRMVCMSVGVLFV
jgi:hypothetical protein